MDIEKLCHHYTMTSTPEGIKRLYDKSEEDLRYTEEILGLKMRHFSSDPGYHVYDDDETDFHFCIEEEDFHLRDAAIKIMEEIAGAPVTEVSYDMVVYTVDMSLDQYTHNFQKRKDRRVMTDEDLARITAEFALVRSQIPDAEVHASYYDGSPNMTLWFKPGKDTPEALAIAKQVFSRYA